MSGRTAAGLVALLLVVSGCSGDSGDSGSTADRVESPSTAPSSPSASVPGADEEGAEEAQLVAIGDAFEIDGLVFAAGWTLAPDSFENPAIPDLQVTNNRDLPEGVQILFRMWQQGKEVAGIDCLVHDDVAPGATGPVPCFSVDLFPAAYDQITVHEPF